MYNYCNVEGFHRFVRKTFKNFFSIIQDHWQFLSMIHILDFWKALLNSAAMLIQENNQNLFKYFTALPSRKQETHQEMR